MESEHKLGGQRSLTVVCGPLAGYAAGFRQALIAQGYARRTIGDQMSMMAHLSRWLEAGGLDVKALQSAAEIDRFFAERRAGGYRTRVSRGALSGLFGFLSDHEIIGAPAEPATGPVGRLLAEYRLYLRDERGAAPGTICGFTACAAMFLQSAVAPGRQPGEALSGPSAADITRFVARWARSRSHAYSRSMVSALRSLMRFLHVAGYIPRPLAPRSRRSRAGRRSAVRTVCPAGKSRPSWPLATARAHAGAVTTPSSCCWRGWDCGRPRWPPSGSATSTGGRGC
jgi:integrase/recombinase XerD